MWYRALGEIVATIEVHSPQHSIKNQVDGAVASGDVDSIVRLVDQVLTNCARELCFRHGLYEQCNVIDRRVVSGQPSEYRAATSHL